MEATLKPLYSQKNAGELFNKVAPYYDLMNDIMSFGTHRLWKRYFIRGLPLQRGNLILDLAGGTGDIASLLLKTFPYKNISTIVYDLSFRMLQHGFGKRLNKGQFKGLNWCAGSADALPLKDHSIDGCTLAFGLRNMENREKVLQEIYRVLKPGGFFSILEFSPPQGILGSLHTLYNRKLLPFMGQLIAQNPQAYEYLAQSIQNFWPPSFLKQKMEENNFIKITSQILHPWPVCIHHSLKA